MSSSKKEPHIGVLPDYDMEPIKDPDEGSDHISDYICLFKVGSLPPVERK